MGEGALRNLLGRTFEYFRSASGLRRDTMIVKGKPYVLASPHTDDFDEYYSAFENAFRGTDEAIQERLRKYAGYVKDTNLASAGKAILDLGCGRGEFLRVMKAHGVNAAGIDTNDREVQKLRSQGFDASRSDAFSYLEQLQDGGLAGACAFQFIEHLEIERFRKLVGTLHSKIAEGGVIILETVNPKCQPALCNFFLDPTHVRPYNPEFTKFSLEWAGFRGVFLVYSTLCPVEFRKVSSLECNYMDYAVVGYR